MKFLSIPVFIISFVWGVYSSYANDDIPKNYCNPIIRGAFADPSICRVGDYYYITNSSVEWFPGLPIHRSKDLVNWELIGYGMKNKYHNSIKNGVRDSNGIFAPTIRYHDGLFYIITTNVGGGGNFYITASDPAGEWSEPVWLHSKGIDPSLFWDDDGKCYYIGNGNLSGKKEWYGQGGIWMQELDLYKKKLVGEPRQLTFGHATNARWDEGPHLYKIEGKYVLLLAEGGTAKYHAVTCFVSDSIWGEYVPEQINPIITHRHLGLDYPIYAVGHADLVKTQNGEWWMVLLGKRRGLNGECNLGRETFLTPVRVEKYNDVDNKESISIIVNPGEGKIPVEHKRPLLEWSPVSSPVIKDDFNGKELGLEWVFLRTPMTDWYSLCNGRLSIDLRPESASKFVNPSMIVKRIKDHIFEAEAEMLFSGFSENEEAGIILYRSSGYYTTLTKKKNNIIVSTIFDGVRTDLVKRHFEGDKLRLGIKSDGLFLSYYLGESEMNKMSCSVPLNIISDKYQHSGFGGTMIGIYATSNGLSSKSKAEFEYFILK